MAIYVWLSLIEVMILFDSYQNYHESHAYQQIIKGNPAYEVRGEKNTKLWRD